MLRALSNGGHLPMEAVLIAAREGWRPMTSAGKAETVTPAGPPGRHHLTTFRLTMITMSIIVGVQLAPEVAAEGMGVVFYVMLAFFLFAIPAGLAVSQMVTNDRRPGGIYSWTREALGDRWGFLAIWLQWAQAVLVMPALLGVSGASAIYAFSAGASGSRYFLAGFIVTVFWLATLLNLRGMKVSSRISTIGVIFGVAIPAALIIGLGVAWLLTGRQEQISFGFAHAIPDLTTANGLSFVTVSFFLYVGTEIPAAHIREVDDPRRSYPVAIFSSVVARAAIMICAALAVAAMVPVGNLSFTAGLMQALEGALDDFHFSWLVPIVGVMVAVGVFAQASSMMAGPSRAIAASGRSGDLPPRLQVWNSHGMPTSILILQGVVATVLAGLFLVFDPSDAFFLLNQLAGQLYMTMYIVLFVTAIALQRQRAPAEGSFRIPGGRGGTWVVGLVGAGGAAFAVVTGFFPPSRYSGAAELGYYVFLVLTLLIFLAAPFALYHWRRPSWRDGQDGGEDAGSHDQG
ncbi:MAG: Glutamate/gamma-aminobutyrate antiporter [Acidimicrobiales bacterium]|nr:MAG: amino acid permease [Actinomycetota bacterium]MBV6507350.1 Glutamate/gamma-aminobutyrate antiporter [Acidimicrobiales bacterium]RIK04480.1 MAG: hypothetical protein DCC48_13205 [Acidobacteriota bacterium]